MSDDAHEKRAFSQSKRAEVVARALAPIAWAALGVADTLAQINRRTASLRHARAAITALDAHDAGERGGMALVPEAALRWLNGEGPDRDGHWFGDGPNIGRGAYWWRKSFREWIAARPATAIKAEG